MNSWFQQLYLLILFRYLLRHCFLHNLNILVHLIYVYLSLFELPFQLYNIVIGLFPIVSDRLKVSKQNNPYLLKLFYWRLFINQIRLKLVVLFFNLVHYWNLLFIFFINFSEFRYFRIFRVTFLVKVVLHLFNCFYVIDLKLFYLLSIFF